MTGREDAAERLNVVTHAVAAALALGAAALVLGGAAGGASDRTALAGLVVFCVTAAALYAVSTLYHAARGDAKRVLRKLDHCAIYVMIAGGYAGYALGPLRSPTGLALLAVVCALALVGIAHELRPGARRRGWSVALCLAMGWAAAPVLPMLAQALDARQLALTVGGGLAYTLGVPFCVLDHRWRHAHGTWHLFTMAGTGAHFAALALALG